MINWTPYLESVCKKYAQWWDVYTLTDVAGKMRAPNTTPLLADLRVQAVKDSREEREEETEQYSVLEGLRKYAANHVLLVGRPGSGKSTALVRLLLEESQKAQGLLSDYSHQEKIIQIPILVELRYYETSIIDLILQFLKEHNLIIDSSKLETILLRKTNINFLLFFDGINELPSEKGRLDLQRFRKFYGKVSMIFSTRDIGLGGDLNLEKKFEMLPLTVPQMKEFVRTYLHENSEAMLKQLGDRLREFGQTPLLLWMLCCVFKSNDSQIPNNLGLVFRQFTEIYDRQLKADVSTFEESREWWRDLLQILAWKMTEGESKTEIKVAISRREAELELTTFVLDQGLPKHYSKKWLDDLLKHHLIQLEGNDQITFRHQLIQEYYAAEILLEKLSKLSDEELQWNYLNYLKWTESFALMLGMVEKKDDAINIIELALAVDIRLGARLGGAVKSEWQKDSVNLILGLDFPKIIIIDLLARTCSEEALFEFKKAIESDDFSNFGDSLVNNGLYGLRRIASEKAVDLLREFIIQNLNGISFAIEYLSKISSEKAIESLIQLFNHSNINDETREEIAVALGRTNSHNAIQFLISKLNHNNSFYREYAIRGLCFTKNKNMAQFIIPMLNDSIPSVRARAVIVLGDMGEEIDCSTLKKVLSDSDPNVRNMAIGFLSHICNDEQFFINEINKALSDEDEGVRLKASLVKGLHRIEEKLTSNNSKNVQLLDEEDELENTNIQVLTMMIFNELVDHFINDSNNSNRRIFIESVGQNMIGKKVSDDYQSILQIDEWLKRNATVNPSDFNLSKNYTTSDSLEIIFWALDDDAHTVREAATNVLIKIASLDSFKYSSIESLIVLQEALYEQIEDYDLFTHAIEAIQWKLGFYSPLPRKSMNQQVYISYNWQEDSNEIADQIVQAFEAKGIEVIRDKNHTIYKDSIEKFMQQIGQGQCVIVVISDRYLKSPNCMFELVEIAESGDFYNRIFPIILPGTKFYKAIDRLNYTQYWDEQIKELETAMKSGSLANLQGITDDLNLYTKIRSRIASLTDTLKDMNTLNIDIHCESGFVEMIQAVEAKLAEDSQNSSVSPSLTSNSFSQPIINNTFNNCNIGGLAHNVQGNQQVTQINKKNHDSTT